MILLGEIGFLVIVDTFDFPLVPLRGPGVNGRTRFKLEFRVAAA